VAKLCIPQFGERQFNQVTLCPPDEFTGQSRIHRHDFQAKVVRQPIPFKSFERQKSSLYQAIAQSRTVLLSGLPFRQMRDLTVFSAQAKTFTALLPVDGGGLGLLEADLMFTDLEQARRWRFASRQETPLELLRGLRSDCPQIKAIVLILTSSSALVDVNGKREFVRFLAPTLALQAATQHIAEVATHLLGAGGTGPGTARTSLAVEFTLEVAASPGGLEEFPALRRRYAQVRKELRSLLGSGEAAA
jgi:hypothetical protein